MRTVLYFTKRNTKLFFKDKGMFFTSIITPLILLVLYATFLGKVYKDSFLMSLPENFTLSSGIINGLVGAELVSSLLSVSCVTVAFCSNFLMVQDKANKNVTDFAISPVKPHLLAIGYYISSIASTLLILLFAAALCLIYIAFVGWYMSVFDVVLLLIDIILMVMFGTALSSVINFFLSTQGQISAVGTIVSSGYGFISGAYMPISSFNSGLQNAVSLFPGTYGTSLVRNHCMRGGFAAMSDEGVPSAVISEIKDAVDCNICFFGNRVPEYMMFLILIGSVILLGGIYVILNNRKKSDI